MAEVGVTNTDRRTHATLRRHVLTAGMALVVILVHAGCSAAVPSLEIAQTHMNVARLGHTATLLQDGRVLVAGGDENGTAELYEPRTGKFTLTASIPSRPIGAMAVRLSNGQVLIAGGDEVGTAELFDPTTGQFVPTGSMHEPHSGGTVTLLPDGRVLVAGGSFERGGDGSATAELYDPKTGAFTLTGSMNDPRELQTATLMPGVGVLMVGGIATGTARIASAEIYYIASGKFQLTGSLSEARSQHAATLLQNGQVLVVGGVGNTQDKWEEFTPSAAELFDPLTLRFKSIAWPFRGNSETASLMPDGRVLIIGWDAILYDPGSESFTDLGSGGWMSGRTETALEDGRVLVTGGWTEDNDAPSSSAAAIYELKP